MYRRSFIARIIAELTGFWTAVVAGSSRSEEIDTEFTGQIWATPENLRSLAIAIEQNRIRQHQICVFQKPSISDERSFEIGSFEEGVSLYASNSVAGVLLVTIIEPSKLREIAGRDGQDETNKFSAAFKADGFLVNKD